MPSPFTALEDRLSRDCDAHFGDEFEFRPMTSVGGGRSSPDASREVLTGLIGVASSRTFESRAFGAIERTASRAALRHDHVSIDKARFLAGQDPRRNDRLKNLVTGVVSSIADIGEDDVQGRYKFRLVDGVTES